eukprot:CAMPEP_0117460674 /NCGR_PEP_ID=MMETSP0784-20121206/2129_1 /TAXON_ID=39447 /ORGANISM="" /LENGTH=45 /DNA_ID= /DNA_START= /DNA_END= /DNA_ORIENTATION=
MPKRNVATVCSVSVAQGDTVQMTAKRASAPRMKASARIFVKEDAR